MKLINLESCKQVYYCQDPEGEVAQWFASLLGCAGSTVPTGKSFLFTTKELAEEVAFLLKAEQGWDGLNAINLTRDEVIALETAAGLGGTEYCWEGQRCLIEYRDLRTRTMYSDWTCLQRVEGGDQ